MSETSDLALHHSKAVARALFGVPKDRGFNVRYWDGTIETAGDGSAPFTLRLDRPGALRRMLLPPSELSIVEAFLSADVDIEGDLETAVTLGDDINARLRSVSRMTSVVRHLLALPRSDASFVRRARAEHTVVPLGQAHEKVRDQAAIRYHYDVGNDFYQLWLDERMVYSCAYFESPHVTLEEAQVAKLDLVCRKLQLQPGDRLLDVGCGWGALIMHAAQEYGVTALGITLSDAQAALARQRIAKAGLASHCTVEIRDYRDLRDARFDKISSIGMVEHVGVKNLAQYFSSLYAALEPGGLFLNHGIVGVNAARPRSNFDWIEKRIWKRDAFIEQYVFPDGRLGPLSAIIAAAEAHGFETRDVESLREHYAMTLRAWLSRLVDQSDKAIAMTNERIYRTWRLYMTGAAFGFTCGNLNVVQTLLSKSDASGRARLPLTRRKWLDRASHPAT